VVVFKFVSQVAANQAAKKNIVPYEVLWRSLAVYRRPLRCRSFYRELGRAALLVGGGVRRSQQVEDARMKQILMVFAAVLVSSTFALADTPVTPAESEKIELALEAFGCTGGKTERRLRGAATLKSMTPSARTTRIQFPFAFSLR